MVESQCHLPVLSEEVLTYFPFVKAGHYIDATFGRGGHSQQILARADDDATLLAIDKDPQAIAYAKDVFGGRSSFTIEQDSFANLKKIAVKHNILGKVDAVLLDLGVSSPQLDNPERGFSFMQDGPLDMRMDPNIGLSASEWINHASESTISGVLKDYGEERFARRIAKAIVSARKELKITRTCQLAKIISDANPKWEKNKHPATRSFQGIRIFINNELDDLKHCLNDCLDVLKVGGRLITISFHSLEDRIVKKFIAEQVKGGDFPKGMPVSEEYFKRRFKHIAKNVRATRSETDKNPRSRSAVLRVAEKIQ